MGEHLLAWGLDFPRAGLIQLQELRQGGEVGRRAALLVSIFGIT